MKPLELGGPERDVSVHIVEVFSVEGTRDKRTPPTVAKIINCSQKIIVKVTSTNTATHAKQIDTETVYLQDASAFICRYDGDDIAIHLPAFVLTKSQKGNMYMQVSNNDIQLRILHPADKHCLALSQFVRRHNTIPLYDDIQPLAWYYTQEPVHGEFGAAGNTPGPDVPLTASNMAGFVVDVDELTSSDDDDAASKAGSTGRAGSRKEAGFKRTGRFADEDNDNDALADKKKKSEDDASDKKSGGVVTSDVTSDDDDDKRID